MAQIDSEGNTIAWSYDQGGKMLGFTLNGVPYFYIRNLQGDVVGIYDAAGAVVATYAYDAWGKILDIREFSVYTIGRLNPIRYRGYYYDTETGYYYCQSRYYNPEWCRWISADVYMDTGDGIMGTNMYAYCQGDPVNFGDPSGHAAGEAAALAAGGFASSMWWLVAVDGPIPIGDIVYAAGIGISAGLAAYAAYKQIQAIAPYIEVAVALISGSIASQQFIDNIDWGDNQRRDHTIKGSGKSSAGKNPHLKGWKKFGFDPQGNGGWDAIKSIITATILGADKVTETTKNGGTSVQYAKDFVDEGVQVIVNLFRDSNDVWRFVDAKPFIK
jgi:RHS repeat-associated protein